MASLGAYLRELLPDMSDTDRAARCGIGQSHLSKIMRGERPPSLEAALRIGLAAGVHPAEILERGGAPELARLCREVWGGAPSSRGRHARLEERLWRLVRLGLAEEVDGALKAMERWERIRPAFEVYASGTDAAVLALAGEVLLRWRCTDREAERIAAEEVGAEDWRMFAEPGGRLRLYLKGATDGPSLKEAETVLSTWGALLEAPR